jgi:cytochrome b subunit of formate dehydrogenase
MAVQPFPSLTHAVVIVSFFLLVITGPPPRFSCAFWSEPLIRMVGGVQSAGLLHRIGAVVTFGYFAAHVAYAIVALIRAPDRKRLLWGPDSIIPHPKDFIDLYEQLRWYAGRGPRPRFARFSYMEKFDYFAVFWGVAIIGGSGLLLWFPEFFASFLPGWIFNVATIMHADEALLASGFIFTIHFFHVHLRSEKFPLDAVMFTGRATRHYMEEEHPLVELRLGSGPIPGGIVVDAEAPPPTRRQSLTAAVLGFLALGVGVALIGMILWAVSFC